MKTLKVRPLKCRCAYEKYDSAKMMRLSKHALPRTSALPNVDVRFQGCGGTAHVLTGAILFSEAHLKSSQTSSMELFTKIGNGF